MLIQFLKPDYEYTDNRGSLIQLVHEDWKQINIIRSLAGQIRGNHYHKKNKEAFFVISGEFNLKLKKGDITETYYIEEGHMFQIEPYIRHTFEFLQDTILIGLYDQGIENPDGERDIFNSTQ